MSLVTASAQDAQPAAPKAASATGKWLAEQEPQWQAAFQREVQDVFDKSVAELKKQYLAALEAQLSAASRDARLDEAVALRAERDRVAGGGELAAGDDGSTLAAIKTVRAGMAKSLAGFATDRAVRAKAFHARYDAILAQSQTALTQRQRFDEALEIKAKREQLGARWLDATAAAAPPSAPPVPPTGTPATPTRPGGLAIASTVRPAERMDLFLSGSNGITLYINHKEAIKGVIRDKASKVRVGLREGDLLIVCISDRWDINSLWMSCISSNNQFLFETSEKWTSYIPADEKKWWILAGAKEEKPAAFAPDKQEYVDLVKKAMKDTPLSHNAQPIRSVLKAEGRATYVHYTVTREDLLPKPDPVDSTK